MLTFFSMSIIPAAERTNNNADGAMKGWDEDRKLIAGLSNEQLIQTIASIQETRHMLKKQIRELSKAYGELITKEIPDNAAIQAIEAQQSFVVNQLKQMNEYVEELIYQLERNNPTDQA